ncbi:cobalt-precorrin-6A reductase [Rhodococcus sp. G-MC3]|uniref:cobalt-precorrin-6A reductase n=1 Tax=Rhodococcus sp. G-MC3 TaxID=3046209 RepID=UPI0024B896A6|nr:cobalt-precorrin-6A reductase [Rhodococcus sp. G-MC3]MDJ0394996.1 cobalt-precorrin-6A reductase [Rhodococcus sp. G-MC3]
MKVLVLGGTSESRTLAAQLVQDARFDVVTSLAGRVRDPRLPEGATRIGGFGGVDGIARWIRENAIDVVVDATHPFAATISRHAESAAEATGIPLLVVRRAAWSPEAGDNWIDTANIDEAAHVVESNSRRTFLTIGRQGVPSFAHVDRTWFLIRSIDAPTGEMPRNHEMMLARGPFDIDDEITTMRDHDIDVVVTKNSGGAMTESKLAAARTLGIPVVMIARPSLPTGVYSTSSVEDALQWLRIRR